MPFPGAPSKPCISSLVLSCTYGYHVGIVQPPLFLQQMNSFYYVFLAYPLPFICLDMARSLLRPWEIEMPDRGGKRFFPSQSMAERDHLRRCLTCASLIWISSDLPRCLHSLNICCFLGAMCPCDDASLVAPRFPSIGSSGGGCQNVRMRFNSLSRTTLSFSFLVPIS
ncbi:hypothetical protein Tco_0167334 [Tanacetum coccineum]